MNEMPGVDVSQILFRPRSARCPRQKRKQHLPGYSSVPIVSSLLSAMFVAWRFEMDWREIRQRLVHLKSTLFLNVVHVIEFHCKSARTSVEDLTRMIIL